MSTPAPSTTNNKFGSHALLKIRGVRRASIGRFDSESFEFLGGIAANDVGMKLAYR